MSCVDARRVLLEVGGRPRRNGGVGSRGATSHTGAGGGSDDGSAAARAPKPSSDREESEWNETAHGLDGCKPVGR